MLLIACRASPKIGFGHLTRGRAIADMAAARGLSTLLVGPTLAYAQPEDHARFADWIEAADVDIDDRRVADLIALAAARGIRHVMLDDYGYDGPRQQALRDAGLRVLTQYDASKPPRFAAQLAVNASPAEHAGLHRDRLYNPDVRFLNGPRHAVLREEFAAVDRRPPGRPVRRILATFGGGDDRGGGVQVIEALAGRIPADVTLVIMSGRANPALPAIEAAIGRHPWLSIELAVSPAEPARLMASCDMAIMAGGTSVYEAAFLGLPMLLLAIAENQYAQCGGWEGLAAARYLGPLHRVDSQVLAAEVDRILADDALRARMGASGVAQVDLNGANRLLDALLDRT